MNILDTITSTVKTIRDLGFRVFLPQEQDCSFGFFTKGKNIGYFQAAEGRSGVQFATVNKVPGSAGMGFLLEPDGGEVSLKGLTKEYLSKAFAMYPDYFNEEDKEMMPVIKHADLEDFLTLSQRGHTLKEVS